MIIYRAMSEEEFQQTVRYGKPDWSMKKCKWFSPNLDFVMERVRDGKFNNSNHCPERYTRIIEFDADISKSDWNNGKEIQFNVRRNPKIKVIKVIK